MNMANDIFASKSKPNLEKVQQLLGQVNETVQANVMTDEQMLTSARNTRFAVLAIGGIAIFVGILLAVISIVTLKIR